MCLVSLVTSGIGLQLPPLGSIQNWPPQQVYDLAEVIARLDRIDEALGLKDCQDDAKAAFLKELHELVNKYSVGFTKRDIIAPGELRPFTQRTVVTQPLWSGDVFGVPLEPNKYFAVPAVPQQAVDNSTGLGVQTNERTSEAPKTNPAD